MTQPSTTIQMLQTFNAMVPSEGPKVIPVTVDLRTASSAAVDLSNQQMLHKIAFIQGVYVDNLDNPSPLSIIVGVTNQRITIAAGRQQYCPLLVPNPPQFIVESAGAVQVPVFFLNIPLPMAGLDDCSCPSFEFDDNGNLLVSDPAIEALINDLGGGPALNVNIVSGGGGGGGGLTGLPVAQFSLTSGPQTLLTATGAGARFRLTGIELTVDPTIFHTGDGDSEYTWSFGQAATRLLFAGNFYLPKAATIQNGIGASSPVKLLSVSGFEDVGTVDNEVLRWNQPASISGGSFYCTIYGTPNYVP